MGTQLNFSIAFHRQTNGQSKRTIQTVEDMLRICVIDFRNAREKHLTVAEFVYNNSDYSRIGMAPFEALYGRRLSRLEFGPGHNM